MLLLAQGVGLPLADDVARQARRVALEHLDRGCALEVMVFDRDAGLIGHAAGLVMPLALSGTQTWRGSRPAVARGG